MINKREFWGLLILIVGLVLLLSNFHFIDYSVRHFMRNLWPLILIVIGVALIVRHTRRKTVVSDDSGQVFSGERIAGDISKTFGDLNIDLNGREIDGLDTSTTFGDMTINLAGAKLKSGINRIRLSGVFGDMIVIVPSNIEAFAYATNTFGDIHIFGKMQSGISNSLQNQTEGYEAATVKVHISAGTTFGDVKIFKA